jgi:hypothetical protein
MAARIPKGKAMPQKVSTTPDTTAVKVINVPTDRSIPPVMITKVAAIASTPLTEVACKIARMFDVCKKFGDATEKKISSTIRLANASSFCCAPDPFRRLIVPVDAMVAVMSGLLRWPHRVGWQGA